MWRQGCFSVEGISFHLVLSHLQLEASSDPNVLTGTPCCPGVVEGVVRVVTSIEQTSVQDNSDSYHWGLLNHANNRGLKVFRKFDLDS